MHYEATEEKQDAPAAIAKVAFLNPVATAEAVALQLRLLLVYFLGCRDRGASCRSSGRLPLIRSLFLCLGIGCSLPPILRLAAAGVRSSTLETTVEVSRFGSRVVNPGSAVPNGRRVRICSSSPQRGRGTWNSLPSPPASPLRAFCMSGACGRRHCSLSVAPMARLASMWQLARQRRYHRARAQS